MSDFWNQLGTMSFSNEGNVEAHFVMPLLSALGYAADDIDTKFPVIFQEGRLGRKPEADIVCFNGTDHSRDTSLLVVEAKRPGEGLSDGRAQGESYQANLRAPLLLLTDGENLEIWQYQDTRDNVLVLGSSVSQLAAERGRVEQYIGKQAVIDYCASFGFKTIAQAAIDYSRFDTAEMRRILHRERLDPSISRQLSRRQAQPSLVVSNQLLTKCPTGAVILAPSGYGKTTLSRQIHQIAIEDRRGATTGKLAFDVPLPDLEQSGLSLIEFMRRRLAAHCPAVTEQAFTQILRRDGAVVICDGLDRTLYDFRKQVTSELAQALRDYSDFQLFVLSRIDMQPVLPLPVLELQELDAQDIRKVEALIQARKSVPYAPSFDRMTPTLQSLCANPLLCHQILEYCARHGAYPEKLDTLFRSWLDNVLDTEPNDFASLALREQALTIIAEATKAAPISRVKALAIITENGIAPDVLNTLVSCHALRTEGGAIEVSHEALADYLRTKVIVTMDDEQVLALIPSLNVPQESFFPVLLMAQLPNKKLQSALWRKLSATDPSRYFDALRYRSDLSQEVKDTSPDERARIFIEDILDGIELPLDAFFPHMRRSIAENLLDDPAATFAATGVFETEPASVHYTLHAREGSERVAVGQPRGPGIRRGVNLDLSRYRVDSGRLLGTRLLKDELLDAVRQQRLDAGPAWAGERLIGRVRFLCEEFGFPFNLDGRLEELDAALRPNADEWVNTGSFGHGEHFSIQSVLGDIALLRTHGHDALDPWWLRLGWSATTVNQPEAVEQELTHETYRRAQQIFAEVVSLTLPIFARPNSYFAALPVRWQFYVGNDEPAERHGAAMRGHPVASWDDAGADVVFEQNIRDVPDLDWDKAAQDLAALGRADARIPDFAGSGYVLPQHEGREWTGYYNGSTAAMQLVRAWLKEEIKQFFDALPAGDTDR